MRLYLVDLENFLRVSVYSKSVELKYRKYLTDVGMYLSKKIAVPLEKLDLESIYIIRDQTGSIIIHKQLDAKLLDEYFRTNIDFNYYRRIETSYALGSFFEFLERNFGFVNPVLTLKFDFKLFKPELRPKKTLSIHQLIRLNNSIVHCSEKLERDLIIFALLFSTGCRISELLTLKVDQIDFDLDSFILQKTKNKISRVVVMKKGLGLALRLYCKQMNLSSFDYLLQQENGKPLTRYIVYKLLRKYCNHAKLDRVNIHMARHTFATIMHNAGCNIPFIKQLLGHTKIDITRGYIENNYIRNTGIKMKQNQRLYEFLQPKLKLMNMLTKENH